MNDYVALTVHDEPWKKIINSPKLRNELFEKVEVH